MKVDAETNPSAISEPGSVVTEVGVAIARPAEFVIFRISQFSTSAQVSEQSSDGDGHFRHTRCLHPSTARAPRARAADGRARIRRSADAGRKDAGRHSPGADFYGPVVLHHKTEFLGGAAAFLGDAVSGFFDNGGGYCYVVAIKVDPANGGVAATRLTDALDLTTPLDDVDLVAIPDAQALLVPATDAVDLVLRGATEDDRALHGGRDSHRRYSMRCETNRQRC